MIATACRVLACTSLMRAAMLPVASDVWRASSFTSPATTANPLPASPARAASMVAFRARSLVCSEISPITRVTSLISPAACSRTVMALLAAPAFSRAVLVTRVPCSALAPISAILALISSVALAALCMDWAICFTVSATFWVLTLISSVAPAMFPDWEEISSELVESWPATWDNSWAEVVSCRELSRMPVTRLLRLLIILLSDLPKVSMSEEIVTVWRRSPLPIFSTTWVRISSSSRRALRAEPMTVSSSSMPFL